MVIKCATATEFYNAISELVARGLRFEADTATGIITLTGGH